MADTILGIIWSVAVWLAIAAGATSLGGCHSLTVADLAGRALQGCQARSLSLRGGNFYQQADLHIDCRSTPAPEYRANDLP